MATNHTQNYALNLWEPADKFVREEFNENSTKIDAAIKAVDAKADTKASTAALAAKAEVVIGTYTGTFTTSNHSQSINLGFRPKAVIVWAPSIMGNAQYCGQHIAAALDGAPYANNGYTVLEITAAGFTVKTIYSSMSNSIDYPDLNNTQYTYRYIAFR